jgi:hypothetical protein
MNIPPSFSQRSLRWCRLIEIPNQPDIALPVPPAGRAQNEVMLTAESSLFMYVQCWQRTMRPHSVDGNIVDIAVKQQGVQHPPAVKAESSAETGAPSVATDSCGTAAFSLADFTLTTHLYHPSLGAVWRTDVGSLAELRPSYMSDDAAFLAVFESIFRSTTSPQSGDDHRPSTKFFVFPPHLSASSPIVRVDVRMSARGGHASVAICALHCSKVAPSNDADVTPTTAVDPMHAVSNLWTLMSRDVDRLSGLQTASDAALAAAAATEQRMVELAKQHQQDCDTLLSGFVEVLNQKKKKIRELTTESDMLRRRMATLEEAFGSGGEGSDREGNEPVPNTKQIDVASPGNLTSLDDDDVQWIDPNDGRHLTSKQHAVAEHLEGSRKRSRSSNASREELQPSKSRGELSENSLDHLLEM